MKQMRLAAVPEPVEPPPDGYVHLHLGEDIRDADRRLRGLAEYEVSRAAWADVQPEVRAAYVAIYGRRAPPPKEQATGWAARAAMSMACGVVHVGAYEDEERAAIEADAAEE